jgi:nucleotide-binding universal stress UspA family protein
VVAGNPSDVILDVSRQAEADVIVLGSQGMSGGERLLFGSTTEYVLRRADVSVLIVPPQWTPARVELPDLTGTGPLIVGIDFSPSSVLAASAAAWLAASLHAWIDIVHVVAASRVLERWQAHATASVHERVDAARRELSAIVQRLAGTVPLDTRVEVGDVPERLTAVARAHPALSPLIVLGRQAGGSRGSAPGAIAYRVLAHASVPVLVYLGQP